MEKRILSFEEACTYTGFAESYMYKLTSARKIPHSKPNGKKIFFDKQKLDEWLLGNPIKTADQLNAEAATYITAHAQKKPENKIAPDGQLLKRKDIAKMFGIKPMSIWHWERRGIIKPTMYVSGRPLYAVADVQKVFTDRQTVDFTSKKKRNS